MSRYLPKDPARDTYRSASSRAAAFDQALREAMGAPVTDRITTEPPARAALTAGADIPESYYPYRVAPVPAILDADSDASDSDGVKHHGLAYGYGSGPSNRAAYTAEMARLARLRRWQETRG